MKERDTGADEDDSQVRIREIVWTALARRVHAIDPIEAGLGARRFFRVCFDDGKHPASVVARMDAAEDPSLRPAGIPPEPALEPVRALLAGAGLPVPSAYGAGDGWMLLEDVGETSLEQAAASLPKPEIESLYAEACSLVPRLQGVAAVAGHPSFSRRLDDALFSYKAEQFIAWTLPWARGGDTASTADAGVVRAGFAAVAEVSRDAPARLAHRDFKAANLHLHPRPEHDSRLVMIDLQGAFLAPPEYDLVCLLRDSHVALDEAFVQGALDRVRSQLPDAPAPDVFARRFDLLTLTRNGKDLSRYLYAAKTRGDQRYLRLLPRAVRTLQAAARRVDDTDPRLRRLADLVESLPEPPCAG